ncbi:MAG: heme transporter HemC [Candidatus Pelagibacter sp.]|nr:heme transporter HemC [Candidatus Pelagibacter sp.]OUV87169.1 MAG: heme transporter HemC [Pelagibacteraceae bacterium TMED136]|tara:strand:+ start:25 stop:729 length:705 start_codon:yes stop_codon:yes gene_type:complete
MQSFINIKNFKNFHDHYIFWIKVFFLSLVIFGLIMSLFISPADYLQGDTVRIMYVHVPASWLALKIYAAMSICGFITLIFKTRIFTLIAKSIAPIGFTFSLISLFTGSLWGQPTWGTFWTWDARLTSMLVLVIFYILYIIIWKFVKTFHLAEKLSSIISLIGLANLPIIKFSVEWWNTLHQPATIKFTEASTIHSSMLTPLIVMFLSFLFFSIIIFLIRFKLESLNLKLNSKNE